MLLRLFEQTGGVFLQNFNPSPNCTHQCSFRRRGACLSVCRCSGCTSPGGRSRSCRNSAIQKGHGVPKSTARKNRTTTQQIEILKVSQKQFSVQNTRTAKTMLLIQIYFPANNIKLIWQVILQFLPDGTAVKVCALHGSRESARARERESGSRDPVTNCHTSKPFVIRRFYKHQQ